MCAPYVKKIQEFCISLRDFLGLPLLNCILDFVIMFSMPFVHISHDDKLLKTRARHIHTIYI